MSKMDFDFSVLTSGVLRPVLTVGVFGLIRAHSKRKSLSTMNYYLFLSDRGEEAALVGLDLGVLGDLGDLGVDGSFFPKSSSNIPFVLALGFGLQKDNVKQHKRCNETHTWEIPLASLHLSSL
jgi:hypothetical protein